MSACLRQKTLFQSTLPVWGATLFSGTAPRNPGDFNPRSPCGERPDQAVIYCRYTQISIHAPRVGSDDRAGRKPCCKRYFNPRSPCGERRPSALACSPGGPYFNPRSPCGERLARFRVSSSFCVFQSTLPVWGATRPLRGGVDYKIFQSTLPVWGATQDTPDAGVERREFQSTLPVWGATAIKNRQCITSKISIHAPRVGSDKLFLNLLENHTDFNPRSPCGERL